MLRAILLVRGNFMTFITRWLAAFILLATTYNPTPYSYVSWVMGQQNGALSLMVLAGLLLLIGYIIYLRATLRSIGGIGVVLVLALVGAILWVLYDLGVLDVQNSNLNTWLGLLALSIVLGVGLSWSHVRRALSGQADMDDVDE
ncbi:MAG: Na+/melibiose symporter-like transporter [Ascidiaceihabitans sp.]|jgi:Na+/melibiose symporter-like transporter